MLKKIDPMTEYPSFVHNRFNCLALFRFSLYQMKILLSLLSVIVARLGMLNRGDKRGWSGQWIWYTLYGVILVKLSPSLWLEVNLPSILYE